MQWAKGPGKMVSFEVELNEERMVPAHGQEEKQPPLNVTGRGLVHGGKMSLVQLSLVPDIHWDQQQHTRHTAANMPPTGEAKQNAGRVFWE